VGAKKRDIFRNKKTGTFLGSKKGDIYGNKKKGEKTVIFSGAKKKVTCVGAKKIRKNTKKLHVCGNLKLYIPCNTWIFLLTKK